MLLFGLRCFLSSKRVFPVAVTQDKGLAQAEPDSLVRTASQNEQRRRVAAVQQLHDEIGMQQRLDDELQRVQDDLAQLRASQA